MKMFMMLMALVTESPASDTPDVLLLDFTASYCQPCKQMLPILQRMEQDKYPIRQIDITEEHELARKYNVDRVPTMVLLVEGKEVKRFVGLRGEDELRQEMNTAARKLRETREAASPQASQPALEKGTPLVAENSQSEQKPQSKSLGEVFRGMFGKSAPPEIRGQSPDAVETGNPLETAQAATVRIRVQGKSAEDQKLIQDVGTGTIVYSKSGETVILTCAHFFLKLARQDKKVEVEVFEDGSAVKYPAEVLGGDHNSDLAFLRIRPEKTFPCVGLTSTAPNIKTGEALVSFGCDDGKDPSRLETKLLAVNKYNGPGNLSCTVDPKGGRSGGGLFRNDGVLVGVCSCADRNNHEGLYMSFDPIHTLVQKLNLQYVCSRSEVPAVGEDVSVAFQEQMEGKNAASPPARGLGETGKPQEKAVIEEPQFAANADNDAPEFDAGDPFATAPVQAKGNVAENVMAVAVPSGNEASGPEITIIIDDKRPGSQKRVIVIPQASAWMLEMLTGEGGGASGFADRLEPTSGQPRTKSAVRRTGQTSEAQAKY